MWIMLNLIRIVYYLLVFELLFQFWFKYLNNDNLIIVQYISMLENKYFVFELYISGYIFIKQIDELCFLFCYFIELQICQVINLFLYVFKFDICYYFFVKIYCKVF